MGGTSANISIFLEIHREGEAVGGGNDCEGNGTMLHAEKLSLCGQKPIGGMRGQNSYAGTGDDIAHPMAIIVHAAYAHTGGENIRSCAPPWAIFNEYQLRSHECRGGMAAGEGVGSGVIRSHPSDGVFHGADGSSHDSRGGRCSHESLGETMAGFDAVAEE